MSDTYLSNAGGPSPFIGNVGGTLLSASGDLILLEDGTGFILLEAANGDVELESNS